MIPYGIQPKNSMFDLINYMHGRVMCIYKHKCLNVTLNLKKILEIKRNARVWLWFIFHFFIIISDNLS